MVEKQNVKENFTKISNLILKDKDLDLVDRGMLVTIYSLPNTWRFSIRGLASILPCGESAICSSLKRLEEKGYIKRTTYHGKNGCFETFIQVFYEKNNAEISDVPFEETDDEVDVVIDDVVVEEIVEEKVRNKEIAPEALKKLRELLLAKKHKTADSTPCLILRYSHLNDQNLLLNNDIFVTANEIDEYREIIKKNIDYDTITQIRSTDKKLIDELLEIMVEAACSKKDAIRVSGQKISKEMVKSRMDKINKEHILYVLDCFNNTKSKINNIKAYLLTALYNAPYTIDSFNKNRENNVVKTKQKNSFYYENQRDDLDFDKLEEEMISRAMKGGDGDGV